MKEEFRTNANQLNPEKLKKMYLEAEKYVNGIYEAFEGNAYCIIRFFLLTLEEAIDATIVNMDTSNEKQGE